MEIFVQYEISPASGKSFTDQDLARLNKLLREKFSSKMDVNSNGVPRKSSKGSWEVRVPDPALSGMVRSKLEELGFEVRVVPQTR